MRHKLKPPSVHVLEVIKKKAFRAYGNNVRKEVNALVYHHDVRTLHDPGVRFSHIVTSPPYMGYQDLRS